MAAAGDDVQCHSVQQGISNLAFDYYDIMVIGKTGMGKSTTADKLLVANPSSRTIQQTEHAEPVVDEKQSLMSLDDLSVWLLSDAPDEMLRVKTRLKNLIFFRSLEKPHQEINGFHSGEQYVSGMTQSCELISNESTKVRVLDVPGFFGEGDTGAHDGSASEKARCTMNVALNTMRKILLIQATMNMKFRRILYFLPEHGPLNRSSSLLEMELTTMANYFGRAIFECMVLIATMPAVVYEMAENVVFPDTAVANTRKNFDKALTRALPKEKDNLPTPPIVFVSMTDSCETIFEKINRAVVTTKTDEIQLKFNPMMCTRCGIKAKIIKSEKIAVYTDESETSTIPYEESTCHPMLVPKYKLRSLLEVWLTSSRSECFWGDGPHFATLTKSVLLVRASQGLVAA